MKRVSQVFPDKILYSWSSWFFPYEQLYAIHPDTWYADIVNYLVAGRIPESSTKNDRDRFFHLVKFIVWDDPYLFKYCSDQMFRRCIPDHEVRSVLSF